MATILEKVNDILNEKKTKIIPENIKAGVKIFDIEGAAPPANLDTSDATATADDIAYGKTAYVNNEKITGSVDVLSSTGCSPADNISIQGLTDEPCLVFAQNVTTPELLKPGATKELYYPHSGLAAAYGVTGDIILKGNVIFGVEGTAEVGETIEEAGYIETPWGDIKNYALQKAGLIPTNILGVYISVSKLYTYKDDNDAIYYQMELDVYNDGTTYTSHMYGDRTITLYDAEGNQLYSDFSAENYIPNAGMKTGTGFQGDSYSTSVNPNIAKATRLVWEFDLSTIKDVSV